MRNAMKKVQSLFAKKGTNHLDKSYPDQSLKVKFSGVQDVSPISPRLVYGNAQSIGMVRDHNEDSIFSMTAVLSEEKNRIPFGLFIVADGMGGHQHGEVASSMATRALASYLYKNLFAELLQDDEKNRFESVQELLEKGVAEAQKSVVQHAPGSGTTLTAAVVMGEQLILAHVGDSRAYFVSPENRGVVLTRDHSLVNRLIELGEITEEEAAVHPQRNVLYRAIGQQETFVPDIQVLHFPKDGCLLLCSDGLWGVVSKQTMLNIVDGSQNLDEACNNLVNAANECGGPDNISVILVKYLV